MNRRCALWWRPSTTLQLIIGLVAVEGHITVDHVRLPDDPFSCPLKCECERVSNLVSENLEGGASSLAPPKQLSLAVYCYRGGLDDGDFLNILQTIPTTVSSLEIVAPQGNPNNFQWNDNLNRLSKLTHLKLVNCRIPTLSQTIRLPSLQHLTLSGNLIDQLQIGPFVGLPALESLDLSHNNIDTLSTGAFLYLKKLKRLSLSDNHLHTLAAGLLNGPRALEELELDGNTLGSAKPLNDLFSDVPHLRRLEINGCELGDAEIGELQLTKVPELRRLGLGRNKLTRVPSSTIRALPKLSTVDLSSNAITRLEPCAFCSCNISRVLLKGNLLGATRRDNLVERVAIDPEAFADTRLQELDLSFNQLSSFTSDHLYAARPTLRVLHLSGNSLHYFNEHLIESLPQLTDLHMAANGIREFPHTLGGNYRQLRFLNLSSNLLEQLPPNMGSLLPKLISLDISQNNLTSISHTLMSTLVGRLDEIYLNDNPWECECAVQPLQHYMLQRLNYRTRLSFERTLCASPSLLSGQPLHRVHLINDCAIFFGSGYGLTEASELLLLLATLLGAAFLVSILVILLLYCGREHKQKALYITGENGTRIRHPLANGYIKANGEPIPTSHSLGPPETLLLANGYTNHASNGGSFQKLQKSLDSRDERRQLINTDHNFNTLRSPPPPPPLKSTRLVTF